jgi:hypothetical protein
MMIAAFKTVNRWLSALKSQPWFLPWTSLFFFAVAHVIGRYASLDSDSGLYIVFFVLVMMLGKFSEFEYDRKVLRAKMSQMEHEREASKP